jgi:hypothetical protein
MNPATAQNPVVMLVTAVALLAVAAWFVRYCLADLTQAREVRYLPRETWRLIILIWIPFGGMLYLMYGKVR